MTLQNDGRGAFSVIAFLWACAHAVSMLSGTAWFAGLRDGRASASVVAGCVVLATALWTIVRPGKPCPFLAMTGLQVVQTVLALPEVPNHRILMFCVNVGVWLAFLALRLRRSPSPLPAELAGAFARISPGVLMLVYFFAFFAKLNTDFLDADVSCGTRFFNHIPLVFPVPGSVETTGSAAIWVTLLVEALLPAALFFRRTRRLAVLAGLLFHFTIALDLVKRFYNFSAVMSALLVASLGTSTLQECADSLAHRLPRGVRAGRLLFMVRSFFAAWLAGAFLYGILADPSVAWRVFAGAWAVWMAVAVFELAMSIAAFFMPAVASHTARGPRAAVLVPLLLIAANGCGPYLGFKTRTSFNMYSNLRLEANAGNHLLFSRSLDLGGFLADDVELLETNDEVLRRDYLEKGYHITYFELERHLAGRDNSDLHLVVRRGGRTQAITDVPPPTLGKRILWKLLVFRPLGPQVVHQCIW